MEEDLRRVPQRILEEVSKVVIGKDDAKEILLVALLAEGHVLVEGLAGTAKTLLCRTFSQAIGGVFKRIQFAPDLLPSDITGFYLYWPSGEPRFQPGPIFANVVLADELNRATPRTQAALLEAMQERQVTVERETHLLPYPFMVVASQLVYGAEGTYPLTEVQIDRFMFRVWSGFPEPEEEKCILERIEFLDAPDVRPVTDPEEIRRVCEEVRKVYVAEELRDYIVRVVGRIRGDPDVLAGPSPRGSIALYKGARALAFLRGRDYVIPDDIKRLVPFALPHRIKLRPEAEMEGLGSGEVVERALEETPVPKGGL